MTEENIYYLDKFPGRGFSRKAGGSRSNPTPLIKTKPVQAPERPHDDYRIVFFRKWGKGKRLTGESPVYLWNSPEYVVARALIMEDHVSWKSIFRKERGEFCVVERFVAGDGKRAGYWQDVTDEMREGWK